MARPIFNADAGYTMATSDPSTGLFRCQMAPSSGLGVGEPASFGLTKHAKSSSARCIRWRIGPQWLR